MPVLYGQRTGVSSPGHELIKAGVSEVIDQGSTVVVLFSALNAEDHAVELMPPQIQLGGMNKTGKIIRNSRWSSSDSCWSARMSLSSVINHLPKARNAKANRSERRSIYGA